MLVLRDSPSIHSAAQSHPDPNLRSLITQVIERLSEFEDLDLGDLVHILIVELCDTLEAIDTALGFPILNNRFDAISFGQPGFSPCWEVAQDHGHWYELVYVMRDDGFGIEVFIPKVPGIEPQLLAMCAAYAIPAEESSP